MDARVTEPAASVEEPVINRRDPTATRAAILEAAGRLLAEDGAEGLSVSRVAQRAGVNRGTAYQHFATREELLAATTAWVGDQLREAVFGKGAPMEDVSNIDPGRVAEIMAQFAMDNPELGRAWLFEMLGTHRPDNDPFWSQFRSQFEAFTRSDYAQPGVDTEIYSVMVVMATFLWPVFVRAQSRSPAERKRLAKRFSDELLRLSLHGTVLPAKFEGLKENNTV